MDIFTLVLQVKQLKKDVLDDENSEILQPNLTLAEDLLLDIIPVFQIEGKEAFKIWLQLLHNCLTKAKSILHRYGPSQRHRQRCLDCVLCKPGRLFKEIKEWGLLFDHLFHALESDISVIVRGRQAVIAPVITPIIPLMKDVIEEEEKRHILLTELKPLDDLLLDIDAVFQDQHKAAPEALKIWLQLLQNSLTEANSILHCYDPDAGRRSKQVNEWKVIFDHLFRGLRKDFSMFLSADQLVSTMTEEELLQALSKDEAWEMFRGLAFCNDNPIPVDIEECAKNIADECKSFHLAIIIWRLKGLRNLTKLLISIKGTTSSSGIEEGIMGTWLNMRHLVLDFDSDVMVHLPHDMKKMSKLQLFYMQLYRGSSLPDYICNFQHLEQIDLVSCDQLRELSPLERVPNLKVLWLWNCGGLKELGIGNSRGFSMLERLVLWFLNNLESIGGALNNGVWNESTLPRLRILDIGECPKLKRLPVGMDKLPKLSKIVAEEDQWNQMIWEDDVMKIRLQRLYKEWKWKV